MTVYISVGGHILYMKAYTIKNSHRGMCIFSCITANLVFFLWAICKFLTLKRTFVVPIVKDSIHI